MSFALYLSFILNGWKGNILHILKNISNNDVVNFFIETYCTDNSLRIYNFQPCLNCWSYMREGLRELKGSEKDETICHLFSLELDFIDEMKNIQP
jgi:hypothetical protein